MRVVVDSMAKAMRHVGDKGTILHQVITEEHAKMWVEDNKEVVRNFHSGDLEELEGLPEQETAGKNYTLQQALVVEGDGEDRKYKLITRVK